MGRTVQIVVALVLLVVVLLFMTTYTVRFTQTAVVTTFGSATEASVVREPGLGFKLPVVQQVDTYDTRSRVVEARSETLATADNRQIIVQSYVVWRISDALKFYQAYSNAGGRESDHVRQAEEALRARLRSALSETSRFQFGELLSAQSGGNKLPELEQRVLEAINQSGGEVAGAAGSSAGGAGGAGPAGGVTASGVSVLSVGIHSIELPESVTETIYKSMEAERRRIASSAASAGEAAAAQIRSSAEADAARIKTFAERRAMAIRGQGEAEMQKYLKQQAANTELAVFLKNMQFLREAVAQRTTLVLPASFPGLHMLDPQVAEKLGAGVIPGAPGVGAGGEGGAGGGTARGAGGER
jgi:membrane protease subunit HflC